MKTPPVTPASGFGFKEIMHNADHTRFPAWYARSSLIAPGRQLPNRASHKRPPEISEPRTPLTSQSRLF